MQSSKCRFHASLLVDLFSCVMCYIFTYSYIYTVIVVQNATELVSKLVIYNWDFQVLMFQNRSNSVYTFAMTICSYAGSYSEEKVKFMNSISCFNI